MANGRKRALAYQSMANTASMEQIVMKLRIEKLQMDKELLEAQEVYFDKLQSLYLEIDQLGFDPSILD